MTTPRPTVRPIGRPTRRPTRRQVCWLFTGAAIFWTAATALGAQVPEAWSIDRREWRQEAPELASAKVTNRHGDIRIRPSQESEAYVLALEQHHIDDPRRAKIDIRLEGDALMVTVLYPTESESTQSLPRSDEHALWDKRRVDLTVLVPAGADLEVETDRGLAEVRKIEGDLRVRSRFGEIRTAMPGSIDAESEHGRIQSELRSSTWRTPPRFKTVNGDIALTLPRTVDVEVELASRGLMTTDYSIEVDRDAETGHKTALARIGAGGTRITVESTNGAIQLLQSFLKQ